MALDELRRLDAAKDGMRRLDRKEMFSLEKIEELPHNQQTRLRLRIETLIEADALQAARCA